jgi:hypothetical protein
MIWALIVILTNADGSLYERVELYRPTVQECEAQLKGYDPGDRASTIWVASCQPRPARPHR